MASTAGAPRRGGWYHGWNIVAISVLAQLAANGLAINCMSLFLGEWARDLHTPISQLLLAMLGLSTVTALSAPVVGALADKYPSRWLFSAGLIGIAAFCFLMSMVNATWQFLALYGLLFPISLTLCTSITANAVVSRWFVKRIGVALGITASGVGFAGVVMPPIIAQVMPLVGWREVWRGVALLTVVVILPLVLWAMRDRPGERDGLDYLTADGAAHHRPHGHGAIAAGGVRWKDILSRRNFWLLVIAYLPIVALYGGLQQNLAPITTSHGFDLKLAGPLLSVFSLAGVVGTLGMGVVSDRFGNRVPLAAISVTVAIGGLLIGYGAGLPMLFIGAALAGVANGMWTLLPAAMAVEFGASGVGRAFGALMLFLPINSVAPAFIANVQERTGSYGPAMLALGALCVIGAGVVLLLKEKRGGHPTAAEKEAALEEAAHPAQ